MKPKIFCIGFHKTGTSSLAVALRRLGYRVTGPNGVHDPDISRNALPMALRLVKKYDAFQDNPWPVLFREMDQRFPGSRFILTLREPQSWIESQLKYFGEAETPMRQWIYGHASPRGNESVYLDRYRQHNEEVLDYFSSRPGDLLTMEIMEGEGWQTLCEFLGHEVPLEPFPHVNKSGSKSSLGHESRVPGWLDRIRNWVGKITGANN